MSPRHESLWDWFDALERGARPRPRVEVWPRGGGKSTTVELGAARVGAKLTRRFVLYVCETQDQADSHVQSIATLFEALGVRGAVNQYGRARAWRRSQLQTENGFNVAAFGLDVAQRGIKVDQYRPDLIVFDDIDGLHDSLQVTTKKVELITQSILPTGSVDCAVLVAQNIVHANSIVAQLADGRADFLHDRTVATVEPAVEGLEYETLLQPDGPPRYRVTGGAATWLGQDLEKVEGQINSWGLTAFLRESQHEVAVAGSLFFPSFRGLNYHGPDRDGEHVCLPFDVPRHWTHFGGLDWGYHAPFCFLLKAVDEAGDVVVIDEIYQPGLTNPQQADAVKRKLEQHGLDPRQVLIAADPSMWAKKVQSDGIARADIEDFWSAGLNCVKANNNRAHGFSNVRNYLEAPHALRIFKGRCPNLLRTLPTAVHDKLKIEDLDDDADIPPGHMDAVNTLRYGLGQRLRPARALPRDKTPEEVESDRRQAHIHRLGLIGHAPAGNGRKL